jgi:hypothetical protein
MYFHTFRRRVSLSRMNGYARYNRPMCHCVNRIDADTVGLCPVESKTRVLPVKYDRRIDDLESLSFKQV